jgi:hypothetical protein
MRNAGPMKRSVDPRTATAMQGGARAARHDAREELTMRIPKSRQKRSVGQAPLLPPWKRAGSA